MSDNKEFPTTECEVMDIGNTVQIPCPGDGCSHVRSEGSCYIVAYVGEEQTLITQDEEICPECGFEEALTALFSNEDEAFDYVQAAAPKEAEVVAKIRYNGEEMPIH